MSNRDASSAGGAVGPAPARADRGARAGDGPTATGPAVRRQQLLTLDIDSLAYGGRGVARRDGYVVFVAGGLPGDQVRAEVTKAKRQFAEARTVELLQPGPERVPDRCLHAGEPCPGAAWQGLDYGRQLETKQEQVDEALRRIGELAGYELEPIVPATERWRYRNKLEYGFGEDGGELVLGFHARGRWDRVVAVEDCLLASEPGNQARNRVRDWARAAGLVAYDRRSRKGLLRNLVVREGRRSGQLQSRLVTSPGKMPRPPVDLHTVIEGPSGGTEGPTGALGEELLAEELLGLRLRISHSAFFQTNTEMAERLYELARDYLALRGRERVFDLYCGAGTLSLVMARDAGEVWGLEIVPEAVEDAARNADANGLHNVRFMVADARTGVRPLLERAGRPDVLVVDPPRAGLSRKIVRRLIECGAPRIVYVSCNPTTLAPNAAQLAEAGYTLRRVRPVDMFPQTPHIECVALLERER
jgi:23S rRNA (uracil1939-C5)-methyltransferase